MPNTFLLTGLLILALSACAKQNVGPAEPSELEKDNISHSLGEECKDAKNQLDKMVEEGQLTGLRELKRSIELHCLWRRN